jgi:hypothetical protein
MKTTKFTRKPFEVDAVQVTAENIEEVAKWCQGDVATDPDTGKQFIKVRVMRVINERQTQAYVGDWVLYAGTGYKVYTPKAFQKSFVEKTEELRTVAEPAAASA